MQLQPEPLAAMLDSFVLEESRMVFRAPASDAAVDRRSGRPMAAVRSNVIVHRERAAVGDLDVIAQRRVAELMNSLPNLRDLSTGTLVFADGAEGRLVQLALPITDAMTVRQLHALRLDEGQLTAITLTVDEGRWPADDVQQESFALLARLGAAA